MSILVRIEADKREEVRAGKRERPLPRVEAAAREAPAPRRFRQALEAACATGYGLIAEIKKASPSKGVIRSRFDPSALARAYAKGGAACLSVLTDAARFQGRGEDLVQARDAGGLPVLRKDFLVDPWQVAESRSLGADCVLVIMAMVSDLQAEEIAAAARAWKMDVLFEVHTNEELERALLRDPLLLGINNRDLNSFTVRLETTEALLKSVPDGVRIVSESGIGSASDLRRLARQGVRAFLVGESLMRAEDVERATRELLGNGESSK